MVNSEAAYPSGKGAVCKTVIQRFKSACRLQKIPRGQLNASWPLFCVVFMEVVYPADYHADRAAGKSKELRSYQAPSEFLPALRQTAHRIRMAGLAHLYSEGPASADPAGSIFPPYREEDQSKRIGEQKKPVVRTTRYPKDVPVENDIPQQMG